MILDDRSSVRKEWSTTAVMKAAVVAVVVGMIAIMPWILFVLGIRSLFGPFLIVISIALSMGLFRSFARRKFTGVLPQFQFAVESFAISGRDRIRENDVVYGKTSDEEFLGYQEEETLPLLSEYDCDEENERDSRTTASPNQKQSACEQELQWNEQVRVKVVRNLDEYTMQERDDCWYSAEEYIRMDRERIKFKAGIRPDENEQVIQKFQLVVAGGKPSLQQSMQWITQRFGRTTLNSAFMDLSNHSHIL